MMILLEGPALVFGTALLARRKRRREKFFDPRHERAFQVLAWSFPDAGGECKWKGAADA